MKKRFKDLVRSPLFWILQVLLFFSFSYLALHFYQKAFPIVDLDIKMDRVGALKEASRLAVAHHWGPEGGPEHFRQSASFDLDDQTQTFVELSAGGSEAFTKIVKEGLYSPFTWRVRHFAEGKTNETEIRFTPQGHFYGFDEKIPENLPGKALSTSDALKIVEAIAKKEWHLPLDQFQLIEKSQETKPAGRIDHSFVYERPKQQIGEGRYRLNLIIRGDRLTDIHYFVKIPDSFSRHYGEMRSSNNTIAAMASAAMVVLYLLGGCGFGIFYLARKRKLLWKAPVICAAVVSGFQLLENVNNLPLSWMNYDTALSANGFLVRNATTAVIMALLDFAIMAVSFMAAEGLSRMAFPNHPQLWRLWKKENASSLAVLGRTLGGYLSVPFFFSFVVFIYFFGTQFLGWWNPSDTMFHPDGLASYCPWFTSIANSLHAGMWEESLFRAVPLAGAALLGNRFGRRKLWLLGGFLIQALIFASAHANYPAEPSYARVVELILPSFMFGGFYLLFGLLPGMILHFTFDAISFSLPLFATTSPGVGADRIWVVLVSLIPLWICLAARIRAGKWTEIKEKELNGAWLPKVKGADHERASKENSKEIAQEIAKNNERRKNPLVIGAFGILSLAGIAVLYFFGDFQKQPDPLEIGRDDAIELARKALEKSGTHLSPSWQPLAAAQSKSSGEDRFIWKTEGENVYRNLIGTYLTPPSWLVRFVQFDANVQERAEEYQVYVVKNGEIYRIRHELPESRSGKTLELPQAQKIALSYIKTMYGLDQKILKEVNHTPEKLQNRTDWLLIYKDTGVKLKIGEARIGVHIAGDQAVSSRRFIFVPEEWERQESNHENIIGIVRTISSLILGIIFTFGIIVSIMSWSQKKFATKTFKISALFFTAIGLTSLVNGFPGKYAQFSTIEPRLHQMVTLLSFGAIKIAMMAICLAMMLGYFHRNELQRIHVRRKGLWQYSDFITGYSIGFIGVLISIFCKHFLPQLSPTTGSLAAMDYYIPTLSGLNEVQILVLVTLFFAFAVNLTDRITRMWTSRKILGGLFLFVFSFALTGTLFESFPELIIAGAAGGIYFTLIYRYFILRRFELLPLSICAALLLAETKQWSLHPYSGSSSVSLFAILCLILASVLWQRRWTKAS